MSVKFIYFGCKKEEKKNPWKFLLYDTIDVSCVESKKEKRKKTNARYDMVLLYANLMNKQKEGC